MWNASNSNSQLLSEEQIEIQTIEMQRGKVGFEAFLGKSEGISSSQTSCCFSYIKIKYFYKQTVLSADAN